MIDKLDEIDIETFPMGDAGAQFLTILAHINGAKRKINELVDAVNRILDYAPLEMAMKAEPETPADPYAEQRKCLCKLCWFWNDDINDKVIGILTGVFDEADKPFERNINQTLYKHCEPVNPDDDIIYKGGDNE